MACAVPLGACTGDDYGRPGYNSQNGYGQSGPRRGDRPRGEGHGRHRMSDNDRIYRGQDGRYYCKRDDGTEGTIIGGLAGGVLGNIIAPGGSKTLGTILGAGAGALGGRAIDRNSVECD
ncbi:glycine zipper 2TM domain-containing protein [Sphingomonas sp. ACRSK]|uniref:glycine zipper 2TM domain-containing protein n=1 Tax=Sphingomonas sp. ACRSK TaxID=2918213 RepID=UPI001EF70C73|nr:glycine zipper 2TM domain-containing protein [Sphingomonas sp. ACRSK]MCG7349347.1 glycine zipper 2TM domain-containing protein [Sphingomonas sp. ACRSK]